MKNGEKIKIGWSRCKVKEHINLKRCFKCCGYNNGAAMCKNDKACLNCGKDHLAKDCTEISSCINCKNAAEKFQINLDVNHPAWSSKCLVYQRKLDMAKKRIIYEQ